MTIIPLNHAPNRSKSWRKLALLLPLLCVTAGNLFADPAPAVKATQPSSITAALQPFVDSHVIAGCVALVATKDKLLCLEPVGYADIETKKPMKADTLFWLASMTKAHSCAAFMILVDEGKVKVDDPVEKYFPEFKGQQVIDANDLTKLHLASHPITIKECMTHTAGLPDQATLKECVKRIPALADLKPPKYASLKEDVAEFGKAPLKMEPGKAYRYSFGIDIVGGIVEVLTGMSYPDYMQQRLFDPLDMKEATFFPNQAQVDRMARTVKMTADKKGIENVRLNPDHQTDPLVPNGILCQHNLSMPAKYKNRYSEPSGGLFATATDVMKFCQMLLNEGEYNGKRVLSRESVHQMTTNQIKGIGTYGFGLNTVDVDGKLSAGSFNHRGARSTMMWVDKKRQLVMVLLLQNWDLPGEKDRVIYDAFTTAAFEKYGARNLATYRTTLEKLGISVGTQPARRGMGTNVRALP